MILEKWSYVEVYRAQQNDTLCRIWAADLDAIGVPFCCVSANYSGYTGRKGFHLLLCWLPDSASCGGFQPIHRQDEMLMELASGPKNT